MSKSGEAVVQHFVSEPSLGASRLCRRCRRGADDRGLCLDGGRDGSGGRGGCLGKDAGGGQYGGLGLDGGLSCDFGFG